MKTVKEHIKNHSYQSLYLLYGTEGYLKKQLKEAMIKGIVGESNSMNYSYYANQVENPQEIIEMIETMPFLGDLRLIVLEETSIFKKASDEFLEALKHIPDTTVVVFIEEDVDKRGRIYKLCAKEGYVAALNTPDERTLYVWIATLLKKEGKKMPEDTIREFVARVGMDMNLLHMELNKLISYRMDKEIISIEDVRALATVSVENQIFEMINALAQGDSKKAFSLYDDLLALKEAPIKIIVLITRQYQKLIAIKDMSVRGKSSGEIAKVAGISPYIVNKLVATTKGFTLAGMKEILFFCGQMDEDVKAGKIKDRLAVELLLTKCLSMITG